MNILIPLSGIDSTRVSIQSRQSHVKILRLLVFSEKGKIRIGDFELIVDQFGDLVYENWLDRRARCALL